MTHSCEGTTWGQGKNHPDGLKSIGPRNHLKPGIRLVPSDRNGKFYNSLALVRELRRRLPQEWGQINIAITSHNRALKRPQRFKLLSSTLTALEYKVWEYFFRNTTIPGDHNAWHPQKIVKYVKKKENTIYNEKENQSKLVQIWYKWH